jgi:hypothetical protein
MHCGRNAVDVDIDPVVVGQREVQGRAVGDLADRDPAAVEQAAAHRVDVTPDPHLQQAAVKQRHGHPCPGIEPARGVASPNRRARPLSGAERIRPVDH